jgi:thiamine-phosphate pyrophosphorylase
MIILVTHPRPLAGETATCNALFDRGLQLLHLRRPGAPVAEYEEFIRGILPPYRRRIVIHDHFELVHRHGLKGIHLNARRAADVPAGFAHVSLSCHSLEEIEAPLPFTPAYLFLSPVFDSISKPGYAAAFDRGQLREALARSPRRVIALGGVTAANLPACRALGFAGGALLGHIWEQPAGAVARFTRLPPPPVASIAGFDPSSGAGVTSDIKTFESCQARGLGICSAITFQNQHAYRGTAWIDPPAIARQRDALLQAFSPAWIKIGLVESLDALREIVTGLQATLPRARIVWDPILKASAGFTFHERVDRETLREILDKIYLVTPNGDELLHLFGTDRPEALQAACRRHDTRVLWTGGHASGPEAIDRLITPDAIHAFAVARVPGTKHGTGCVLSAAITALLARGYPLEEACREGQRRVARFILSGPTLLGRHDIPVPPRLAPLQYITDPGGAMTIPEQVEAACAGGVRWIQLRMKESTAAGMLVAGHAVREICRHHGALFIVNDRVEVALALDADGVHLGREDMDPVEARQLLGAHKIIGATCNTFDEVAARARQGVDYIGLGPFAPTTTKKQLAPLLGIEGYRRVIAATRAAGITTPIHAIGGIRLADIDPLMATGVAGIALSSLIKNSDNPSATARLINNQLCLYK